MSLKTVIMLIIWHIVYGGDVVIALRIILAVICMVVCLRRNAMLHLKIAKFALNPVNKRMDCIHKNIDDIPICKLLIFIGFHADMLVLTNYYDGKIIIWSKDEYEMLLNDEKNATNDYIITEKGNDTTTPNGNEMDNKQKNVTKGEVESCTAGND
eukprot:291318_1